MYKASTQQTLGLIERILNYLKSESYRNQISGHDLSSESSSPYRYNNEQGFNESIDLMKIGFQRINDHIDIYDKGNIDQRNSINNNYLTNIASWLEQSPTGNYNNIIQNINSFITTLGYMGIYLSGDLMHTKDIKAFKQQLKSANDFIENTSQIKEIITKLTPINEKLNSGELSEASINDIKTKHTEIINLRNTIDGIKTIIENDNSSINDLKNQAQEKVKDIGDILGKTSAHEISQYFSNLSGEYKKAVEGEGKGGLWGLGQILNWNTYFFLSLGFVIISLIFILTNGFQNSLIGNKTQTNINEVGSGKTTEKQATTIGLPINDFNVSFIKEIGAEHINGNLIWLEIFKIISNGLIRLAIMLPSIICLWFVIKNRDDKERLRKTYEFRASVIKTLSGQLEQIKQQDIPIEKRGEFLTDILTKIYTEPTERGKENEEGILDELKKTADIMEKVKGVFGKD